MKNRVETFIFALEQDNPGCEAVALYQNGELVIEHHFVPTVPRAIYSHTKSFISTAAGMAIDEGKLHLDDKILDLFPEYAPVVTDERVKSITLRHFLTMSSGFGGAFLMGAQRRKGEGYPDYISYLLSKPLKFAPGERFVYSNGDTHMAACMVQRAVGEPLVQYIYRKLFSKLDIGFPGWETDPSGTVFGGTGLYLSITDMMKLGILYLNDGVWNGERLLSHNWVKAAGSKQISTGHPEDWHKDYGYQFWLVGQKEGAFRADGAYGQYSIILPEHNAVVATQCSEQNDTHKFSQMLIHHVIADKNIKKY